MNKEIFVQNIKDYCKQKGVRQTVACKESGVGTSFINDIERGQTPSVAKVQMLARYLGVTVSDLLGETAPVPAGIPLPHMPELQALSDALGQLTPEGKKEVLAFVEFKLAQESKDKQER